MRDGIFKDTWDALLMFEEYDGWMIVFVRVSYSILLKLLSNSMMDDCSPES